MFCMSVLRVLTHVLGQVHWQVTCRSYSRFGDPDRDVKFNGSRLEDSLMASLHMFGGFFFLEISSHRSFCLKPDKRQISKFVREERSKKEG